jgi:hypothetical protein
MMRYAPSAASPSRASLVCCVAVAFAVNPDCGSSTRPSPPSPPALAPDTARDQHIARISSALDAVIAQAERQPQNPLIFSATHPLAHEAWIDRFPRDRQEQFLDGLIEAGVHRIDINIGLFPWWDGPMIAGVEGNRTRAIETYDRLAGRIRARGLQLVFDPQYSQVYHRLSFDEFAEAAIRVYGVVAARYRPDTLIVVHEPTIMAARMGQTVSPQQWLSFTDRTIRAVKAASPGTRTGVGGIFTEAALLAALMDVPGVEVLTLDIYDIFALPRYADLVTLAKLKGKAVYIEETWRTPFSTDEGLSPEQRYSAGIGMEVFQALDVKWLRALSLWASALNLEAVTPYWTQTLFKYVPQGGDGIDPAYNAAVMDAVGNNERTGTFFGFRDIIRASVPPRLMDVAPALGLRETPQKP